MGTFTVTIGVGNPGGSRFETVDALVDTGATYTMLPASLLRSLGVSPLETQSFRLADGNRVRLDVGDAIIRIDGRVRTSPVVFSEEGGAALLGAVTMEVFSLGVDPTGQRLIPVDALAMSCGSQASIH